MISKFEEISNLINKRSTCSKYELIIASRHKSFVSDSLEDAKDLIGDTKFIVHHIKNEKNLFLLLDFSFHSIEFILKIVDNYSFSMFVFSDSNQLKQIDFIKEYSDVDLIFHIFYKIEKEYINNIENYDDYNNIKERFDILLQLMMELLLNVIFIGKYCG
jgi:hypothetical protein